MKKICVNASNRPSDFPESKWVVEGNEYTIIEQFTAMPANVPCVVLEEIDMEGTGYNGFAAYRFAEGISNSDIEDLFEEKLETV